MSYSLENKVAVIAGGVGGLGREICMTFAEAGANVVIADINEREGLKIVDEIKQFLASPASDFVTGHVLSVNGGWVAE